jgi:hypothetical protein
VAERRKGVVIEKTTEENKNLVTDLTAGNPI